MDRSGIYKEIMREYESDQNAALNMRERRLSALYKRLPRVQQIDREMANTGLTLAKLTLSNDTANITGIRKKYETLKHEKEQLLISEGIPEDYLDDIYRCALCNDTGFVGAVSPKRCKCLKQRLINKYYDLSNLKEVLKKENFSTFKLTHFSQKIPENEGISPRDNIEGVRKIAERFANHFKPGEENLFFYGTTGLGKTFLCHCIAKAVLDEGFTVLYVTAPRLFKWVQENQFNYNKNNQTDEQLNAVMEADLLILDDLGAEFSTIVTDSSLFEVINQRLLDSRSTVISSNLTIYELKEQYTDRIVSRFLGSYKMFKFFGEDIREKKRYHQVEN
jgi:DNA replication protein DnaC